LGNELHRAAHVLIVACLLALTGCAAIQRQPVGASPVVVTQLQASGTVDNMNGPWPSSLESRIASLPPSMAKPLRAFLARESMPPTNATDSFLLDLDFAYEYDEASAHREKLVRQIARRKHYRWQDCRLLVYAVNDKGRTSVLIGFDRDTHRWSALDQRYIEGSGMQVWSND